MNVGKYVRTPVPSWRRFVERLGCIVSVRTVTHRRGG